MSKQYFGVCRRPRERQRTIREDEQTTWLDELLQSARIEVQRTRLPCCTAAWNARRKGWLKPRSIVTIMRKHHPSIVFHKLNKYEQFRIYQQLHFFSNINY